MFAPSAPLPLVLDRLATERGRRAPLPGQTMTALWLVLLSFVFGAGAQKVETNSPAHLLPAGLDYVWWQFGLSEFDDLQIDVTIYDDLGRSPGVYFQMYQGQIGDVGFYFGLQTDVFQPEHGGQGKGLIFSRWKTRDLADVRVAPGGWAQSAGYEGDFIGVRRKYQWTNHKYRLRLTALDEDEGGVWYGFFVLDYSNQTEEYGGSLRFPKERGHRPRIKDGGGTWTELYSGALDLGQLPAWHVSLDGCYADHRRVKAQRATSDYSRVPNTDIYFDATTEKIHILMGPGVTRTHSKGRLF